MLDGVEYVAFICQLCVLVVLAQQPTRDGSCCGKFPATVVGFVDHRLRALRPVDVLKLLLDGDGKGDDDGDGNDESRNVPEGLAEVRVPVSLAARTHNQIFMAVHF